MALPMLVVDLDNSLLRTDLPSEIFFQALGRRPLATIAALARLRHGPGALKARLGEIAELDAEALPYDQDLLARIEAERRRGETVVLVSASHQSVVDAVARKLGCFDAAWGSEGERDLGGEAKARFLAERYGSGSFDYLAAGAAPPPDLALPQPPPAASPRARGLRPYLEALRPHQWLKNLLVFVPLIGAHSGEGTLWLGAVTTFVGFCLVSSAVYVINDLLDLSSDRRHPRKRFRPFASGALPASHGLVLAGGLIAAALLLTLVYGRIQMTQVLAIYLAAALAYSLWLKRLLIIDICMLAGFYTLRVIGGGIAAGLELSAWMLAFSCFLFLSLAAVKRQTELQAAIGKRDRLARRAYRPDDLPVIVMMAIASGYISVLVMALYIDSPEVRLLYESPLKLYGACPFLLYWISRVVMLAHRGQLPDDPLIFAVRDRVSLACLVGIVAFFLLAKYT